MYTFRSVRARVGTTVSRNLILLVTRPGYQEVFSHGSQPHTPTHTKVASVRAEASVPPPPGEPPATPPLTPPYHQLLANELNRKLCVFHDSV